MNNSKLILKPKKPIELDLTIFIVNHIAYFVLISILSFLFPFILMIGMSKNKVPVHHKLEEDMGDVTATWYNGFQDGTYNQLICLTIALIVMVLIALKNLFKKIPSEITVDDEYLTIVQKNKIGKSDTIKLPKSEIKLEISTSNKLPVSLKIIKGYDTLIFLNTSDSYWGVGLSKAIPKLLQGLPNCQTKYFALK